MVSTLRTIGFSVTKLINPVTLDPTVVAASLNNDVVVVVVHAHDDCSEAFQKIINHKWE